MSPLTRRTVLGAGLAGLGAAALRGAAAASAASPQRAQQPAPVAGAPNVLWIVSEDNGPFLGCYGDPVARTPTLDRLAAEGVRFDSCFSSAPVCAPSRFALLTGVYATAAGPAHHMRAHADLPEWLRGFPELLREAGYYCTNNAKTDYNSDIAVARTWNASSRTAHWRNRPAGAPFFSVFNLDTTHESKMFPGASEPLPDGVDPAAVDVPEYLPDTPLARTERAKYYDQVTTMDAQVAALLAQLEADGLADSTIVFYYSDNGGVLPRSKRFCYDSGTRTPLIVRFPLQHAGLAPAPPGSVVTSPVSSVDFAPTVLELAGVAVPAHVQGVSFAGLSRPSRQYAFTSRDRMDHRYDMVRTVRSERYRYIRNYWSYLPYGAWQQYTFRQAGYREWERLHRAGQLTGLQEAFWQPKPAEELYDLATDPDEVHDLSASPEHAEVLADLRARLDEHLLATNDNGFLPEGDPLEGYEPSRAPHAYPLQRVMDVAALASARRPENVPQLTAALRDAHPVVRLWAAHGCRMLPGGVPGAATALRRLLSDTSPSVRVAAAEALCVGGQTTRGLDALTAVLRGATRSVHRLQAANALDNLGARARPALTALKAASKDPDESVRVMARHTVAVLNGTYRP